MAKIANDEIFLNLLPNKWWVNFFKKFDGIDSIPVHDWKPIHQLAYIAHRFLLIFNKRLSFSLKGKPMSCPEMYFVKQMIAVLGTSNPVTIKEYIDWVYDKKIIPLNKKLRSIGFFVNASFCNEFNLLKEESKKIDRTTELPNDYKEIIDTLELPISTYGDLAFAKMVLDKNKDNNQYENLFNKLYAIGFEFRHLEGLR